MKAFFSDSLSVDESRISAIIIGFFVTLGFSMYQYTMEGTIDPVVKNLIMVFIYVIGGIQVSQHVKDFATLRKGAPLNPQTPKSQQPIQQPQENHQSSASAQKTQDSVPSTQNNPGSGSVQENSPSIPPPYGNQQPISTAQAYQQHTPSTDRNQRDF